MSSILVITHTDPILDPRVMKILQSAKSLNSQSVVMGINKSGKNHKQSDVIWIRSIALKFMRKPHRNVNLIGNFLRIFFALEITLVSIYKGKKLGPSIIYCNDWVMLPASVIIKLLTKSKLIYDAHELESETQELSKFYKVTIKFIEKRLWMHIDYFITVGLEIEKWYLENYGLKNSTVIMNTPYFNLKFKNSKNENLNLKQIFNLPSNSLVYIFVGYLCPGRSIDLILNAFLKIKSNSYVVFMGNGPFEKMIKSYALLSPKILIHESIDYELLVPLISTADYGLCLVENVSYSDYLSLPNKLFEYAFAETYIVASDLPEIRKIVEHFQIGTTISSNLVDLVDWIDKQGILRLRPKAMHSQEFELLGWQEQEKKLFEIFSSLI